MFNIHKLPVVLVAISLGLGICMPAAQAVILGGEDWNELVEAAPGFTFAKGNTGGLVYTDPGSGITINGESGVIPTIGQPGTAWGFMPGTTNPTLPPTSSGSVFIRYLTERQASFNDSTGLENNVRWGGSSFQAGQEDSEELLYVGTIGPNKEFFGFQDRTTPPGVGVVASTVLFNLDTVYFVVAEVDIDNELARLWIDPAFGPTAPTPDLILSPFTIEANEWAPLATGSIGSILLKAASAADDFPTNDKYMTADELVIGTTWSDVVPTVPSANFDGDTDVDGHDFLIWQRGFGGPGVLATGDANGDLVVDDADLGIWHGQFGTTGLLSGASATTVPEPGTLALATLATGLACLVMRKRSHSILGRHNSCPIYVRSRQLQMAER